MRTRDTQYLVRLIKSQLLVLVVVTALLLPFGLMAAASGLAGGLISVGSSSVMWLLAFRKYTAQQPDKILAHFYAAEIAKLTFTIVGLGLIIALFETVNIVVLVVVYFVTQVIPAIIQGIAGSRG